MGAFLGRVRGVSALTHVHKMQTVPLLDADCLGKFVGDVVFDVVELIDDAGADIMSEIREKVAD